MKTLRQSLIDFELSQLNAIANCRGVPLATTNKKDAIDQLSEALLSPLATAITVDDLSKEETEALQFLLAHGGQIERARFTRQYGAIRPMGTARLERERPWQSPVNPAEGLWYRGLIFKAFQVTEQGGKEVVYIPSDLLPFIALTPSSVPPQPFQVSYLPAPSHIIQCRGRLRENIFSLLVYLQTHPVRVKTPDQILEKDQQALIQCLLPPTISEFTALSELEFLLHIGLRAELFTITHGRLRPNRETTRHWLQADSAWQNQRLQNSWRADPTWNDLWHVPGLHPQQTGWENSPLKARSKILAYLEKINVPAGQWLSVDSFVTAVKRTDPDFQRPNGNYKSWYIQDDQGTSLMGFEYWDQVEGALIRHLLTHILPLLGIADVGAKTETGSSTAFRLTPAGNNFLKGHALAAKPHQKPVFLRINDKFQVQVPDKVSLYDRFQLARVANLESREDNRTLYRITRGSISKALKNGVTPDQITAFLTRATNNKIPLKIIEALRNWGTRYGTVKFEQVTILRLKNGQLVSELRQNLQLSPLLGEVVGPTTILVPTKNAAKVRQLLTKLGYLEETK